MEKIKLLVIGILMILFISINYSCSSSKQIYYYDDYIASSLDSSWGTYVKLTINKNKSFSIVSSNNSRADTIRVNGNWEKTKDTIFLKYNRKPYKPDIKLECNDSVKSVQLQIFIDDDRVLLDDPFLKAFVNDTLYDGSNLKIKKNKTYIIRVIYGTNLMGECFKVKVGECNIIKLSLQKFKEKTYDYPILSMNKFLKKGNKLYPIFDCSNQKLYKDVYLLINKMKGVQRKISFDGIWHPSISLFDRY